MSSYANRVAVIFNASTPLARALALELALQGFSLALCCQNREDVEDTADLAFESVEVSPFKVYTYDCQMTDSMSLEACSKCIFEDFGRIDILCFVEKRQGFGEVVDEAKRGKPLLTSDGKFLDGIWQKPEPPPIQFFEHIPEGAKRMVAEEEDEDDIEHEIKSTSLILYVSTPDTVACRAGRSAICAKVRTCEALVEALNAEAIAKGEKIRACTALVGTLDGEIPFWKADKSEFLNIVEETERELKRKAIELEMRKKAIEEERDSRSSRSESVSKFRTKIIPRFAFKRTSLRQRGFVHQELNLIEPEILTNEELKEREIQAPSSPRIGGSVVIPKLTSESLSHEEACTWIMWGLSRGRTRVIVGYDLLFLESAWVPSAFLNRLFTFSGEQRNLLPIRTKDSFFITSEKTKKEQARYNAARSRRHKARQIGILVITIFLLFSPLVAIILLFTIAGWQSSVNRGDGHSATENAVAMVMYITSLRRRPLVRGTWESIRMMERAIFGRIAHVYQELKLKIEERSLQRMHKKRV